MMTMPDASRNRKLLGKNGENVVRTHLERLGWHILAVNFRCTGGEMDLIAREMNGNEKTLVFVEVKTRRGGRYGAPSEAVDPRKQRRLVAVAQAFLAEQQAGGEEPACRFDVAEVMVGPDDMMRVVLRHAIFTSS